VESSSPSEVNQPSAQAGPPAEFETETDYRAELERTRSQLLVFARDMSAVYQRKREHEQKLGALLEELRTDYLSIVETLALVVEAKDQYTANHLERCKRYGIALTSRIDPAMITPQLQYGFLLHDVGKIGIPEAILMKPGPLTPEEMTVMRTVPTGRRWPSTRPSRALGRKPASSSTRTWWRSSSCSCRAFSPPRTGKGLGPGLITGFC